MSYQYDNNEHDSCCPVQHPVALVVHSDRPYNAELLKLSRNWNAQPSDDSKRCLPRRGSVEITHAKAGSGPVPFRRTRRCGHKWRIMHLDPLWCTTLVLRWIRLPEPRTMDACCVCDAAYDAQQNVVPFDAHQTPVSSAGFKLQCSAECYTKRNTSNDYLMDCGVPSEPPYYYQVRRCSCCCPPTNRSRLILLVSSLHSVCTAPRHFRS
jgi:hypothetical protein